MGKKLPDELDSPMRVMFDSVIQASQVSDRARLGVTTIGQVIEWLAPARPDISVYFDFCRLSPSGLHSWRGNYADLALGFSMEGSKGYPIKVDALLALLRSGIGQVFQGWKGGDYRMDAETALYIDLEGDYSGKRWIRGVEISDYSVTLLTAKEEK